MKTYKSKISYGFLLVIFFLYVIITYFSVADNSSFKSLLIISIIHISTFLFLLYMFFNTDYTIDYKTLKIRCGFMFKKDIDIDKIKSISKTKSLLSSPAASLTDRIELKFGTYDAVIISPKEKKEFIRALVKINPNIKNNLDN